MEVIARKTRGRHLLISDEQRCCDEHHVLPVAAEAACREQHHVYTGYISPIIVMFIPTASAPTLSLLPPSASSPQLFWLKSFCIAVMASLLHPPSDFMDRKYDDAGLLNLFSTIGGGSRT